jgi:hypothetical protein
VVGKGESVTVVLPKEEPLAVKGAVKTGDRVTLPEEHPEGVSYPVVGKELGVMVRLPDGELEIDKVASAEKEADRDEKEVIVW